MNELLPGAWSWSIFDEARQVDFNGHLLLTGAAPVLVDPVPMSPEVEAAVERLGPPVEVLVTNRDHRRAAARARERWGARVLVPALDRPLMDLEADGALEDGALVAGGALRVVHLPDQKSPGEVALYWAARRLLVLGDALWGKPAGRLTMLPDAKYADPRAARAGLQRLAALDVEVLLVGDGAPILAGAGRVLRETLAGLARR
jgi:glyoxylase-like metal-dependent hydrolase (beta-lactamase superfamily II)